MLPANAFYNHVLAQRYRNTNVDMTVIAGDLNGRVGNMKDFIDTVDMIPEREILDTGSNLHGQALIEFLLESQCCLLNGRFKPEQNAFTNITGKGSSVVDYMIVPHVNFKNCTSFSVETCSDIINVTRTQGYVNSKSKLPDHCLLSMTFHFDSRVKIQQDSSKNTKDRVYYKLDKIPPDFLDDDVSRESLLQLIREIELCQETQNDIDKIYSSLCKTIHTEMEKRVPKQSRGNCKRIKKRHPFWNQELEEKWQQVCAAEKVMKRCTNRYVKRNKRYHYKTVLDGFDKIFSEGEQSHNNC